MGSGCCKGNAQEEDGEVMGPRKDRSCTDVYCIVIFVAFLIGMVYVGYLGVKEGDPYRVLYGSDSWGNTCNRPNTHVDSTLTKYSGTDLTDKPKLFYFDPLALLKPDTVQGSARVCVVMCPNSTMASAETFYQNHGINLCKYDVPDNDSTTTWTTDGACPVAVIQHYDILNVCIPPATAAVGKSVVKSAQARRGSLKVLQAQCSLAGDFFERASSDLWTTWRIILYLCAASIGVSFILTALMRFIARIVIWTLVIGSAIATIAATAFSWYQWNEYNAALKAIAAAEQQDMDKERVKTWLGYSITTSVAAVIILLTLLVMRKRIALVVQLFTEAGKAVAAMPCILFQPYWTLIVLVVFVGGMGVTFLVLLAVGDAVVDEDTKYVSYVPQNRHYAMWAYFFFGILWMSEFIFACHTTVIAGAVSAWYFTRNKSELRCVIGQSIKTLLRYHLGSVLFGSCIVAVVRFLRIMLAYMQRKLKGKTSKVVEFFLKCLACVLWCFEKVIRFLNKNAYIMMAIHGKNFCASAKDAFFLLARNVLRVAAINSVGRFVLFLGKVGVVAIIALIGFYLLKGNTNVCYIWIPLFIAGVFSYFIANAFLSTYGMAIDTIFLCFLEDSEKNNGIEKPYYMSKGLMEYIANSKKAMDELEKKKTKKQEIEQDENTTV